MIRALAVALFVASPVWANEDRWPALLDATGVAGDDVLNVRAAANASALVIGTLAPDARDIEVIGPDDREASTARLSPQ